MRPLNPMNTGRQVSALVMLIAFGILFTGVASHAGSMPKTGFLADYSLLKPNEDKRWPGEWLYFKEGVDWKSYDKVMLDRVTYFFVDDSKYKGIQGEELTILATYFMNQYVDNLSDIFAFTDRPGPNTLRIRTAITRLEPNKPVAATVSTILPIGLGLSAIKKAATGTHIGMGGAGGEIELLDSQTGEILAAGIDTNATGEKYRVDKSLTKWGTAETIAAMWAEKMTARIKELRQQK